MPDAHPTRFVWLRHWEFWLALALGALLRLWRLDLTHFLADQAELMALARDGLLQHALPITGIPSSIHTLNPPLSIYLLMPFAALSPDPFPAVVSLALWNVLGVAFCYIFALRYFGRRTAAIGTLLFATCGAAVEYSRFLWQQNYLPPLLALWALAVYAGCIRGARGAFVWGLVLLAAAAQLHPTALLLLPVLAVAVLLAPRRPRAWEYILGAIISLLLFAPSLVWEWVSGGSDLRAFTTYSAGHSALDPSVLFRLYEALGGPAVTLNPLHATLIPRSPTAVLALVANTAAQQPFTPSAPYALLGPLYLPLALAATLLFSLGWLILSARVLTPALALWRIPVPNSPLPRRLGSYAAACWRGLRADPAWRTHLLLWLGVTLPPALLIRHSSSVFIHYLLILFPFAFLVSGIGAAWLLDRAAHLPTISFTPTAPTHAITPTGPRRRSWLTALVLAALALLIAGQAAQSLLFTASLAAGQFDAPAIGYGYPLGAVEQADAQLSALQRQTAARLVYVMEPLTQAEPLDYLLVRERPERTGLVDACLVLPPPDAGPALVVATNTATPAERLLAQLPNASRVAAIPMLGNQSLAVYRVAGPPGSLPAETPLRPITFADSTGAGLRLEGITLTSPGVLRLRWTVLAPTAAPAAPPAFRMQTRTLRPDGAIGPVLAFRDCAPTRWRGGETVFTWLPAPASWASPPPGQQPSDQVVVQVQESTLALTTSNFGPLRFLSDASQRSPWSSLAPSISSPLPGPAPIETVRPFGAILSARTLSSHP